MNRVCTFNAPLPPRLGAIHWCKNVGGGVSNRFRLANTHVCALVRKWRAAGGNACRLQPHHFALKLLMSAKKRDHWPDVPQVSDYIVGRHLAADR
jgi:hypothetical protein